MKNLVLVFCAFALFAFSSCEKCLNCVKVTPECGYCNFGGINGSTYCYNSAGVGINEYNEAKSDCISLASTWKIASSASTSEQEACGNSSSEAQTKATTLELDGYTCK